MRNRDLLIVRRIIVGYVFLLVFTPFNQAFAQKSVARQWNDVLLEAIRNDFARPTVHARNLFHVSVAMYDAWAAFDEDARPYLLGNKVGTYTCPFEGVPAPADITAAQEEAISYAAYRLLTHRFRFSPGAETSLARFDSLMHALGYDKNMVSIDYSTGSPAALGNYLAASLEAFGFQDNANEMGDYANLVYAPTNDYLSPAESGSQGINDPNRWQPLSFNFFIDQAGFEIPGGIPDFLSPEWGKVTPFSLSTEDLTIHNRDGEDYWVYHDPGPPAYLQEDGGGTSSLYAWNHSLVSIWSSHLDPGDSVLIDISPNAIGNLRIDSFPRTLADLQDFYKLEGGGDPGTGYDINPHTGSPYDPQIVPRGDYARVLAEFWADGPDSETPPGHWFTILNGVNDHPLLSKKFRGVGPVLEDLEWDVKAYFMLGGAMHDAAIASWSVKGWYDYIRPISAIRYMADMGQSGDPALPNYSPEGIPLREGFIEFVAEGDTLAGADNEHVGKIKVFAWRGPDFIPDPKTTAGGVGWILAENWWPYQRPTFVTPPFAGYVSGHSTFSRAAAEVLTLLTGDPYFPGGMGEFIAPKDEFLVFEKGPSTDVILQWAKYSDASDQCSLSRIWGGIHPPVDDIPGRLIGEKVGKDAFRFAEQFFDQMSTGVTNNYPGRLGVTIFPNPVSDASSLTVRFDKQVSGSLSWKLVSTHGKVLKNGFPGSNSLGSFNLGVDDVPPGVYWLSVRTEKHLEAVKIIIQ